MNWAKHGDPTDKGQEAATSARKFPLTRIKLRPYDTDDMTPMS
jgi:hypothetical protein